MIVGQSVTDHFLVGLPLYIYIYAVLICLICFAYYMLHVSKCLIEGSLEVKLPTIWGDE